MLLRTLVLVACACVFSLNEGIAGKDVTAPRRNPSRLAKRMAREENDKENQKPPSENKREKLQKKAHFLLLLHKRKVRSHERKELFQRHELL